MVAATPVRTELAEDLTSRAVAASVPLLDRDDVPEHVRTLTSPHVLAVEEDLTSRLLNRTSTHRVPVEITAGALDPAQRRVASALVGHARLVVVEGAAGTGKTATLAAASDALASRGRRMVVVTPTLQAAQVARRETGSPAFSAAWLAHQYSFRWDQDGAWSREPQTPALEAYLWPGDVLVVDEAGMLDQDTARALLTIADETHAHLALVGDRHQLPAVGRGGVLDLALRWADPDAHLTLDTVHRFSDPAYADLSLLMRTGERAGEVFDALLARGEVVVHTTDVERRAALTDAAIKRVSAGERSLLIADTRDQVAALNAEIRDRLDALGHVDDDGALTTRHGERIGVGDHVTTRRNDHDLDVANRDTWTVTAMTPGGGVTVRGRRGQRTLPADYAAGYLRLAYASTAHAAQGATVDTAHVVVGGHTSAASAYVAMTRGRHHNTAHLVADTPSEARRQWIDVLSRERADLGPAAAAQNALADLERYGIRCPSGDVVCQRAALKASRSDPSALSSRRASHVAPRRLPSVPDR